MSSKPPVRQVSCRFSHKKNHSVPCGSARKRRVLGRALVQDQHSAAVGRWVPWWKLGRFTHKKGDSDPPIPFPPNSKSSQNEQIQDISQGFCLRGIQQHSCEGIHRGYYGWYGHEHCGIPDWMMVGWGAHWLSHVNTRAHGRDVFWVQHINGRFTKKYVWGCQAVMSKHGVS